MRSLRFDALGSECELYAVTPAEPIERVAGWIRAMHRRLTRFEPDSELSRFNAQAGEWVEVSPEVQGLLIASLEASEDSGGLVNVAVLPALIAAGYDRTFESIRGTDRATDRASDEAAGRCITPLPDLLEVRTRSARLAPGAGIDLGGLAKGWIADRAVERLGPNSLANCGGDLRAVGTGPTGEGWPVAFGGRTLLLDDHGAATSGTTKRRWGHGLHHLIDPRTGAPSASDLNEVSVVARTALEAEVLAKTALLLGSADAERALDGRALAWSLT